MPLRPQEQLHERILAIGAPGAGKSRAWLSIARLAQRTGSPARFYCLDTDYAIARMLYTEFRDLRNVTVYETASWVACENALSEVLRVVTWDDWIITDMIDIPWDLVQAYFTEEIWQQDIGKYFLEVRKALKGDNLHPFSGWTDWQVINKIYQTWMSKLIYHSNAHIFATSKIEATDVKTDEKDTLAIFGAYGVKPRGQKHLGHQFHTVLLFSCLKPGDWRLTTVKDRGRKPFEGAPLKDFAMQYLVARAGWKL